MGGPSRADKANRRAAGTSDADAEHKNKNEQEPTDKDASANHGKGVDDDKPRKQQVPRQSKAKGHAPGGLQLTPKSVCHKEARGHTWKKSGPSSDDTVQELATTVKIGSASQP